jgi:hypothetical protein
LVGGNAEAQRRPLSLPLTEQTVCLEPVEAERWALYGTWMEKQLDAYIANLAHDFQGLHHHIPNSLKMGEAGLPDHLLVTGKTFYLEAKRFYRGKPTLPTVDTFITGRHVRKGQETWLRKLWESGTAAFLVYPTDVPDLYFLYAGHDIDRLAFYRRMERWIATGVWHLPCKPK